jgi:hypothetical protein
MTNALEQPAGRLGSGSPRLVPVHGDCNCFFTLHVHYNVFEAGVA